MSLCIAYIPELIFLIDEGNDYILHFFLKG